MRYVWRRNHLNRELIRIFRWLTLILWLNRWFNKSRIMTEVWRKINCSIFFLLLHFALCLIFLHDFCKLLKVDEHRFCGVVLINIGLFKLSLMNSHIQDLLSQAILSVFDSTVCSLYLSLNFIVINGLFVWHVWSFAYVWCK